MDDQTLLTQYVATRDASAFEELLRRYAGLVKGVCVRVLGNSHDAEEVAQDCFLELARNADQIHTSVGGWLNHAATSRSLNVLRSSSRRKNRERLVSFDSTSTEAAIEATTQELQRTIEKALTELPEDLRLPIILHYYDGRSQRDVARELGVHQSTISRRMKDALQYLREKLVRAGYAATIPAFVVPFQNSLAAESNLREISVLSVPSAANKTAGGTIWFSYVIATFGAILPVLSYLVLGGWVSFAVAIAVSYWVARFQPKWVKEVFASLGEPNVYSRPTFCLTRWTWTTPPRGWRGEVFRSFAWSGGFLAFSYAFANTTGRVPWGIVTLGLVTAVGLAVHACRILVRLSSLGRIQAECHSIRPLIMPLDNILYADHSPYKSKPLLVFDVAQNWLDAAQLIGIGVVGLGIALRFVMRLQPDQNWPSLLLTIGTVTTTLVWGVSLWSRKAVRQFFDPRTSMDGSRSWGTSAVLLASAVVVASLSVGIVWNPRSVGGLSISLAAAQASILGWIVFRLAAHCRCLEGSLVRRIVVLLVAGCFMLNSGICLANCLRR